MSHVRRETISDIAESLGHPGLPDAITKHLAPDVEYRTREVIQEALKFMRHSKRRRLVADDVNAALRLRNREALYGFSENASFKRAGVLGGADLYYVRRAAGRGAPAPDGGAIVEDPELDLTDVVASKLPSAPLDVHLMTHWLAIEGVQPAIPANPAPAAAGQGAPPSGGAAAAAGKGKDAVKPVVRQIISKELQQYYEKITELVLLGDSDANKSLLRAALKSLSTDTGLHPLTPLFVQFIADEVTRHLADVDILSALMRAAYALLTNPSLHIEAYLHQLMPSILTCLVGKRLGVPKAAGEGGAGPGGGLAPAEKSAADKSAALTVDHWQLREHAASLVALVCERFGGSYANLQPRITRTLVRALMDPKKPLTTHYGSIVGIAALGARVVQLLLMPNLGEYLTLLEEEAAKAEKTGDAARQYEASRCRGAVQAAVGSFFVGVRAENEAEQRQGEASAPPAQAHAKAVARPNPLFEDAPGLGARRALLCVVAKEHGKGREQVVARQMANMSYWLGDGLRPFAPLPELTSAFI
eukprot:PRCOL_00006138-RA